MKKNRTELAGCLLWTWQAQSGPTGRVMWELASSRLPCFPPIADSANATSILTSVASLHQVHELQIADLHTGRYKQKSSNAHAI